MKKLAKAIFDASVQEISMQERKLQFKQLPLGIFHLSFFFTILIENRTYFFLLHSREKHKKTFVRIPKCTTSDVPMKVTKNQFSE